VYAATTKNLRLIFHWSEYINIWHGTSLEPLDSSLFKWSPCGKTRSCPSGHNFI